ncbi:MAG: metal ABC transporter ATP-binding protein [Methermicoccaceae archaeon]
MEKDVIVELKDVSVYFNEIPIIENVNLPVYKNDFIAIVGPNGGGKTTLLKVILGLIKPDKGVVKVFGMAPEQGRKLIGYLPQHTFFNLDFPITVFDVVLMGRYKGLFKKYSKEDREAATKALKTVKMFEFRDRQIGALSGGQLQRVFLARAIAREPKLLLLDEPTASIDPEMQKSFYELLSELKKIMAIVLVTHDIGAVAVQVDKIACLNQYLFYHDSKEEAVRSIEEIYRCPIDIIAHGIPHRVLREHDRDDRNS